MKRLVLALALTAWAAPCAAERSDPSALGYGVELTPVNARALHRYTLPESVLRRLTDPQLGDVCMFDARGGQVAETLSHRQLRARAPKPER